MITSNASTLPTLYAAWLCVQSAIERVDEADPMFERLMRRERMLGDAIDLIFPTTASDIEMQNEVREVNGMSRRDRLSQYPNVGVGGENCEPSAFLERLKAGRYRAENFCVL